MNVDHPGNSAADETPPPGSGRPEIHRSGARSVVLWTLAHLFLKPIYRVWPVTDWGMRALRVIDTTFGRLPRPRRTTLESTTLATVPAEVSTPRHAPAVPLSTVHVLYLHGGGFLFCAPTTHRHLCSRLSTSLGVPVYSLRYRKLPEAGVGTAVHDAFTAYTALRSTIPPTDHVVVAGDSSGGFLAAKICELAHDRGVPGPAAFIGYSPQLDLDIEVHGRAALRRDAYQPLSAYLRAKAHWDRGPVELAGTRSPATLPPRVFPPTLLTGADGELFETDIRHLTRSLQAAGQTVHTHIWRHQVHAFPVLDALLPESTHAIDITTRFLRETLGDDLS